MNERFRSFFCEYISYYVEKYLISLSMFYYAIKNLIMVVLGITAISSGMAESAPETLEDASKIAIYYTVVRYGILFVFNAFDGCILLGSKRPQQPPQSWEQIFVPLLSSYFMLSYNFIDSLPEWMSVNYIPQQWLWAVLIISCLLVIGGEIVALVAVFYLRRSFAVFVQVRDVILKGPYLYVRHPIYMGHVLLALGVLLSNFCIASVVITILHVGILAYRARLEETALAANDPAYRKNMAQTGFLFPKLSTLVAS
jgi:protein-S-isoprenylcysteine O-methyltransferase Ste14